MVDKVLAKAAVLMNKALSHQSGKLDCSSFPS